MSRYWHKIPPHACDYSGATSLLYGMPTLILLLTPGGCIHPIVEVDEERNMNNTLIYKSSLNEIDMTLGMSDSLMEGLSQLIEKHNDIEFVSILGTPLTKITGMDIVVFANTLENRTHKPTIYIETSGFESYAVGYSNTLKSIMNMISKCKKSHKESKQYIDVGILGYSPLVHGKFDHMNEIKSLFYKDNISSICLHGESLLSIIKNEFSTRINIVTSLEGREVAQYLLDQYGIPYVVDIPIGHTGISRLNNQLFSITSFNYLSIEENKNECNTLKNKHNVMIIGDSLMNESIKKCLIQDFGLRNINCYTILPRSKSEFKQIECKSDDMTYFTSETDIVEIMNSADIIIADPIYKKLLRKEGHHCFIPLPYGAISGKFYMNNYYKYIGCNGFEYFKSHLNNLLEEEK